MSIQLCLTLFLLQVLLCVLGAGQGDLSGHMEPLGAHMAPEEVRRVAHLPSPREFYEGYVLPKTPVIFEGALKNSPVWRKWQDDEYIREHFGEAEVGIEEGKKENRSDPRYVYTVNEFLDRYQEEDIYLVDSLTPGMYQEWLVPRPLMCGGFTDNFMYTYVWFSSGGTKSVLHTDSFENFHCLVSGRKEFVLIEPHYSTVIGPEHAKKGFYDINVEKVDMRVYPELSRIPWFRAVVNEGDCLYLPYQWIHNVNSYGRNMGINIWWIQFEFDEGDCASEGGELPEYFSLGDVVLSPEMMIVESLSRAARPDNSVHADELYALIQQGSEEMAYIELHNIKEMFDLLQPGCEGVLADYKSISRPRIKDAYTYLISLGIPEEEDEHYDQGDEQYDLQGDEHYDLEGEFGGQGVDYDEFDENVAEGGGDFEDQHLRDEL